MDVIGSDETRAITILQIGDVLLLTIQFDLEDRTMMLLKDELLHRISRTGARGVLIDISALDVVDSFIGRMLANVTAIARILAAEAVIVGMRPQAAITLVELGLSLRGVRTALDVDRGLELIDRLAGRAGTGRAALPVHGT